MPPSKGAAAIFKGATPHLRSAHGSSAIFEAGQSPTPRWKRKRNRDDSVEVSATTHAGSQEDAGFAVVRTCRHDQKTAPGRPWHKRVSMPLGQRA